jgi:hypothetical protein
MGLGWVEGSNKRGRDCMLEAPFLLKCDMRPMILSILGCR